MNPPVDATNADETTQSLQEKFPATDIFSHIEVADGRVWLKHDDVSSFAGDLPEEEQKLVWATHAAPVADLFNQKVEGTAWRSKPSWYIVATQDHTIQPELERFVAKRMGATTFETDSHRNSLPLISFYARLTQGFMNEIERGLRIHLPSTGIICWRFGKKN